MIALSRVNWVDPEVLDAPPGRVYTGDMTTPTQRPSELEPDQLTQAVSVDLCVALATVLLVVAGVGAWF